MGSIGVLQIAERVVQVLNTDKNNILVHITTHNNSEHRSKLPDLRNKLSWEHYQNAPAQGTVPKHHKRLVSKENGKKSWKKETKQSFNLQKILK